MIVSSVNFPMINDHSVTATFRAPPDMRDNTRRSGSDREGAGNIKPPVFAITAKGMIPHPILAVRVHRKPVRPGLLKFHALHRWWNYRRFRNHRRNPDTVHISPTRTQTRLRVKTRDINSNTVGKRDEVFIEVIFRVRHNTSPVIGCQPIGNIF
jgi:hypothetical protein